MKVVAEKQVSITTDLKAELTSTMQSELRNFLTQSASGATAVGSAVTS